MNRLSRAIALALALALPLAQPGWTAEVVEPEGAPSAPALGPGLAQSPALSLPSTLPDVAGVAPDLGKAELDARWEAQAVPAASAAGPVAAPVLPEAASGLAQPSGGDGSPGTVVPAPPVRSTRLALAGGWLGLAGLAALTHAPFERVGPLIVSLFLSFGVSFMWSFILGAMSSMRPPAPAAPPVPADPREARLRRRVDALAAREGMPGPKRLKIIGSGARQAQAGGWADDYELRVHTGILELPDEQQEAVLTHELGHVKHEDSLFTGLTIFLAPLAPAIALTSGIISDGRSMWAVPFAAAAVAGYLLSSRLSEYHADQFAARAQKTVKPLVDFFRYDTAASPRPTLVERLASVVSAHPSHARRIARLLRLSK